jgi:hypothetical protein
MYYKGDCVAPGKVWCFKCIMKVIGLKGLDIGVVRFNPLILSCHEHSNQTKTSFRL